MAENNQLHVEDEIVTTKRSVTWSRGKFIQKVYRFDIEDEDVVQAIVTDFPSNKTETGTSARALVVFLKTKAHIYFLDGSSYVVDLPVEVDRAFPAPRGVVIQRKPLQGQSTPSTPQPEGVPPNSFLSSQRFQQSQSFLQSPSIAKSFASTQTLRPSPLSGNKRIDALIEDAFANLGPDEEDLGPLYTLTSPLQEPGAVAYSVQHQKPRLSAKSQPSLSVAFELLDPAERLVYVSRKDELSNGATAPRRKGSLTLLVTLNAELQILTIWHAWYLDEKSLALLVKQRTAHKAAKARRRSSFLSASMGTGTATPVVRREGTRESFAATGSVRLAGDGAASNALHASSRKPTRQEEEDVMASQMDPDYQPNASQTTARESRRISSLNADVRASQTTVNASLGGPAARRNASFGGAAERRSFGPRRSRGSTPGSTFSRSLGPDDDLMDIDGSLDVDGEESVDSIVRHVRATFEAAGADSIYGDSDEEFKRDLVVRKICPIPAANSMSFSESGGSAMRVVTRLDDSLSRDNEDQRLNVYVHEPATKNMTFLRLLVRHLPLWPSLIDSTYIAVPIPLGEPEFGVSSDILDIQTPKERYVERLLSVCKLALPIAQAQKAAALWSVAQNLISRHLQERENTLAQSEYIAFAAVVFVFALDLLNDGARAGLNRSSQLDRRVSGIGQRQGDPLGKQSSWNSIRGDLTSAATSRDDFVLTAAGLADQITRSSLWTSSEGALTLSVDEVVKLMLALHICREEEKLSAFNGSDVNQLRLAAVIAQLGHWLGLPAWDFSQGQYYEVEGTNERQYSFLKDAGRIALGTAPVPLMPTPIGVFQWFERALQTQSKERYPTLDTITEIDRTLPLSETFKTTALELTSRITTLSDFIEATNGMTTDPRNTVRTMAEHGITPEFMESLPIAIAAPFKEAILKCEKEPPTTWSSDLLRLVRRDDLELKAVGGRQTSQKPSNVIQSGPKDVNSLCNALENHPLDAKTKEADRHAVSQLIFNEDRRLLEATSLMHFNMPQVAECPKQPDWSDADHLERQRRLMLWVTVRMTALPAGDAMLHYDSQTPLLTDKYHLSGFSNSCLMQPMGHTMTTDRSGLTEEKVAWAYFHAGVSAGLRISRDIKGIDTSWIAFNKPNELTNRHAGLLLALGLGGHLRHTAKWLSFKYLTPKHTMTSVGLLLGLSASYMGTMDSLITRMLSVHITRMLPPGAAELNISPVTQTAGLMGIGLLYYNTQHRRMSEIMLSEIEYMELEDPDSGPDPLRDESYRLSAGFALGFINLGKGRDLRGLHGMHLPERLLAFAVGPRPVNAVHVFDRATAGAVIATALVFMKSGDKAIASKIDIPDTEPQFDHVRPDILMLRVMAKHIILWDDIGAIGTQSGVFGVSGWIAANLPKCYHFRYGPNRLQSLKTSDIPFYNIITGLGLALSLKFAGSGNEEARDDVLRVLSLFYEVAFTRMMFDYDSKLARSTIRRCIDVLALAAATIMAGTGDLKTFRYLRRLHGRTDPETPYGSHLAAHLAIGVLFLGGGTYTLGTSNLAVASLICAFYPLWPTDVHDNHVHLQAFRHFWVFAAEARCLVVEDIDTKRPISMPITLTLKDGTTKSLTAPCLVPELDTVSTISTADPAFWRVTLDFAHNLSHLTAFKANQRIFVRRCPASEAHSSTFLATLSALNDNHSSSSTNISTTSNPWQSLFTLKSFEDLDKADQELVLPPDVRSSVYTDHISTVIDDRLELRREAESAERDKLWDLRLLFAWAEGDDGREARLGVDGLRAKIEERKAGL